MDFRGQPEIYNQRLWYVGNRTRYQSGVYVSTWEEWTICQFEWYRDNKMIITASSLWFGAVFILQESDSSEIKGCAGSTGYEDKCLLYFLS